MNQNEESIGLAYQAILDLEIAVLHAMNIHGDKISIQSDAIDVIKRLLEDQNVNQQHSP